MSNSAQTLRLTVDPSVIAQNYNILCKASGKTRCGAAVKADAYGCGIDLVAPALLNAGCQDYFVADALEGAKLRSILPHANIYILNGFFNETANIVIHNELIPILNSQFQINLWQSAGSMLPYAIHVDTGMNRLGLRIGDALNFMDGLSSLPNLIMSHFANADDPQDPKNQSQLQEFLPLTQKYPDIQASMANSAATLSNPSSHFDLTRPGIGLYGSNPFSNIANPMKTAVTAEAKIIDIREVFAGETISYGGTFTANKPMKIATCGVGYADGYPRNASGHGIPLRSEKLQGAQVHICGKKINCLGRVTMDLTMFDITDIPTDEVKIGDWVELFGHNISVDELAKSTGTIGYEILTSIGRRYRISV